MPNDTNKTFRGAEYQVSISTFKHHLKQFQKIKSYDFDSGHQNYAKLRDYGFCFKFDEKDPTKLMIFGVFLNNKKLIEESKKTPDNQAYRYTTPLMVLSNGEMATIFMLHAILAQIAKKKSATTPNKTTRTSNFTTPETVPTSNPTNTASIEVRQNGAEFVIVANAATISPRYASGTSSATNALLDFNHVFFPATLVFYLLNLSNAKEKTLQFKRGICDFKDWGVYCNLFAIPLFDNPKIMVPNSYTSPPEQPTGGSGTAVPPPQA